ncbi:hypothetical protein D3C87_1872920 [compost metagenome]
MQQGAGDADAAALAAGEGAAAIPEPGVQPALGLFILACQQGGETHLSENFGQPLVAGVGGGQLEVAAQGIGKQVHPLAHH